LHATSLYMIHVLFYVKTRHALSLQMRYPRFNSLRF
jgi:hypothetical protein